MYTFIYFVPKSLEEDVYSERSVQNICFYDILFI